MTELTDEVRAFLAERRYAIVGTVGRDCFPHLTVVWYDLRGDDVLFNSARGRVKDRNLRRDSRCAVIVFADGDGPRERFVRLSGRIVRFVDDPESALRDVVELGIRYNGKASRPEIVNRFPQLDRVSYLMRIEKVYAKLPSI